MANVKEVALSNQLSGHCSGAKLQGSRSHAQQRNAWVDALRRETQSTGTKLRCLSHVKLVAFISYVQCVCNKLGIQSVVDIIPRMFLNIKSQLFVSPRAFCVEILG